ncbi:MerR family transcriptional regulator [Chloroflexota bacterium]
MFKIGDFSKLSLVTVKTLRYYDEIGLLKPVKVDRFTGYRYYSANQMLRLNYIVALKNLGLSLEEIATLNNNDLTPKQMRDIFILKKAELQQKVHEEQKRLEQVETLLRQIEKEGTMPEYQVITKKVAPQIFASIREVLPAYDHIGRLYEELINYIFSKGGKFAGPTMYIGHDTEFKEKDVDVEAGIPLSASIPGTNRIKIYELPGMDEAATTIYKGAYEGIGKAYEALMAWIESNGCQITGPDRELYLTSPGDTSDPSQYVTEIQFPIAKA